MNTNIFVSWSGKKSHACAEQVKEWVSVCLQMSHPFLSSHDIESGSDWFTKITDELNDAIAGIVCLTASNTSSPWILFESGALAKGISKDRVCTLLCGIKDTDVTGPLSRFNHTNIQDREQMLRLLHSINARIPEDKRAGSAAVTKVFETMWPNFSNTVESVLSTQHEDEAEAKATRTVKELAEEILMRVRYIHENTKTQDYTVRLQHAFADAKFNDGPVIRYGKSRNINQLQSDNQQLLERYVNVARDVVVPHRQLNDFADLYIRQGANALKSEMKAELYRPEFIMTIINYLNANADKIVEGESGNFYIKDVEFLK
jgi:hypothetical protein